MLLLAASLPLTNITGDELPIVLLAAAAFFATNHVLACVACALPSHVWVALPPEPVHVRPNGERPLTQSEPHFSLS